MTLPGFEEEKSLWKKNFRYVIGVDEVGRGAFAGPVTVAAVVFEFETYELISLGINDSKLLKPLKRQKLSKLIQTSCLSYSIITINVSTINKIGIGKATEKAFRKAVDEVISKLKAKEEKVYLLADGFHIKHIRQVGLKNQKAIIKGDRKSISIAAASIIAKVHRDSLMKKLSKKYPEYGFGKHKGYGTKAHQQAIKRHGLSKIHRKSFNLSKFTK